MLALRKRDLSDLSRCRTCTARPVIRASDYVEPWCRSRTVNLPKLDLDGKKRELVSRVGIQPIHGGAVVRLDRFCDPDHCLCTIDPRYVGEDLAKVTVISSPKLVFDDHPVVGLID